jgi:hypothetical protein
VMEKCVFFPSRGWEERVWRGRPLLSKIPKNWAMTWIGGMACQLSCPIKTMENQEEIGYVVDIPYFFTSKEQKPSGKREKNFQRLLDCLRSLNVAWICMVDPEDFFLPEERRELHNLGFQFITGEKLRIACMLDTIQKIIGISNKNMETMKGVILGADTERGEEWTYLLGSLMNHLVLYGKDRRILREIADILLEETGLSAEICRSKQRAMTDMEIVVVADEEYEDLLVDIPPSFLLVKAYKVSASSEEEVFLNKILCLEASSLQWPEGYQLNASVTPWERILLTEFYLLSFSQEYRWLYRRSRLTLNQVKVIHGILKELGFRITGLIHGNGAYSYDRVRKRIYSDWKRSNIP